MDLSIVTANFDLISTAIMFILAVISYILLNNLTKEAFPDLPESQRRVILLALYFLLLS